MKFIEVLKQIQNLKIDLIDMDISFYSSFKPSISKVLITQENTG